MLLITTTMLFKPCLSLLNSHQQAAAKTLPGNRKLPLKQEVQSSKRCSAESGVCVGFIFYRLILSLVGLDGQPAFKLN